MSDLSKPSNETSNEEEKQTQNTGSWFFKLLIEIPAGILVVCVSLMLLSILTPLGRTIISNFALHQIPLPADYSLNVETLNSPTIGEWRFKSLDMSYKQQPLVHIDEGIIQWLPLNIIKGDIHFDRIYSRKIMINQETLALISADSKATQIEEKPKTIEEILNSMDESINNKLKQFSLKIMPLTITNLNLPEIEVHQKSGDILLAIKGESKMGGRIEFLDLKLNLSITLPSMNEPVKLLARLKMDYLNVVNLSLSGSYVDLKKIPVPIAAQLNTEFDPAQRPFRLDILSSPIQVGAEQADLKGSVGFNDNNVTINSLVLNLLHGFIEIQGTASLEKSDLNLNMYQIDPSPFIPDSKDIAINGHLNLKGTPNSPYLKGQISATGQYHDEKASVASDISGSLAAIKFKETLVQLGKSQATASGSFDFKKHLLKINANPRNFDIGQLAYFKIPVPPAVNIKVISANVDSRVEFTPNEKPKFDLSTQGHFVGQVFSIPVDAQGQILVDLNGLTIQNTTAQVNGASATAQGHLAWHEQTLDLLFSASDVKPADLTWLPVEIPPALNAELDANVKIEGTFKAPIIHINAIGPLSYNDLKLTTKCDLSTNLHELQLHYCALQLPDQNEDILVNSGKINFSPLKIDLEHQFNLFPFGLIPKALPQTNDIRNGLELEGKLQGKVATSIVKNNDKIQLKNINADLGFFGAAWSRPLYGGLRAQAAQTSQGISAKIQSIGLDFGKESHFTLRATANSKKIDSEIKGVFAAEDLQALPIAGLETFTQWPGQASLESQIKGNLDAPNVDGSLEYRADIQQLNASGTNQKVPLRIATTFTSPGLNYLTVEADVFKNNQKQSEFELKTNAIARLLSGVLTKETPPKLELTSHGEINLENLNLLLSPVFHQFNGLAQWNIHWNDGPEGFLEIDNGSYRQLMLGTKLEQVHLKTRLHPSGITIENGQATDGEGGHYTVSGFLNTPELLNQLAIAKGNTTNLIQVLSHQGTSINVKLDRVKLVDRPDIESISDGNLSFDFTPDAKTPYLLQGNIQLQPLEIQLDRTQSDSIPEIKVVRFNPKFQKASTDTSETLPIALKLDVNTNQQAFLRGKGINAELEGNIKVRGTSNNPQISGFFKTLRGDADILGKRFMIDTGELRFDDMQGLINIKATHTKGSQTFIAQVTGSFDSLEVKLESDPPLPDDETLSQLLFGKSLSEISAVQALRIAAAVRSFSSGGGIDPLATTRNLLGVDQVTFDSEDTDTGNENYKLGVGKYINDRVYVEIQRSTDPTEPWQGQVQIEITPNVSLETSAESTAGSYGVDLNWKRDY